MLKGMPFIFIYCFYVSLNCLFRCFLPLSVLISHTVLHPHLLHLSLPEASEERDHKEKNA